VSSRPSCWISVSQAAFPLNTLSWLLDLVNDKSAEVDRLKEKVICHSLYLTLMRLVFLEKDALQNVYIQRGKACIRF
jgi:hypothetical protein